MNPLKGGWAVLGTCLLGLFLAIVEIPRWIPDWMEAFRPDWVVLAIFYWSKYAPNRIGVFGAWLLGLLVDVVVGTPLGLNAFCLCGVVFVVLRTESRLRIQEDSREYLVLGFAITSVAILKAIVMYLVLDVSIRFFSIAGFVLGSLIFWLPLREALQLVRRRFVELP